MAEQPTAEQQTKEHGLHASSPKIEQKDTIYQAEYFGSGTFKIIKPKRKDAKRRQSALKGTTRGSRK